MNTYYVPGTGHQVLDAVSSFVDESDQAPNSHGVYVPVWRWTINKKNTRTKDM